MGSINSIMMTNEYRPLISLVVATIGREQELDRLLRSLAMQSYTSIEVIIVDQNPHGFLDAVLDKYKSFSIVTIRTPPSGVSAARNLGLKCASGELIGFPDDDCFYSPKVLEAVQYFFANHPRAGGMLATWLPDTLFSQNKAEYTNDWQDGCFKEVSRYSAFYRGEAHVQFFRKAILDEAGGFDEELGPGTGLIWGCGEDTDLLLRALALAPVWRNPYAISFHPAPILSDASICKKAVAYGKGRMRVLKKNRLPLWFVALNILFPLAVLPKDLVTVGIDSIRYRFSMFRGRFSGFIIEFLSW